MHIAGIDGCKLGWILMTSDGTKIQFGGIYHSLSNLLEANPPFSRVLIDMPMGLSSKGTIRTVDALLRKRLGKRHSTVFNPPCREALNCKNYEEAKTINKTVEGKGISKQTYFISRKINELDNLLARRPNFKDIFIESHPEFCFKNFNAGIVLDNKSTPLGIQQRLNVLSKHYIASEQLYQEVLGKTKRKDVKSDDILDAICLCLVNQLAGKNNMQFIEDPIRMDQEGIRMRIGYFRDLSVEG